MKKTLNSETLNPETLNINPWTQTLNSETLNPEPLGRILIFRPGAEVQLERREWSGPVT